MENLLVDRGQFIESVQFSEATYSVPKLAFVIPTYNHSIEVPLAEIQQLFDENEKDVIIVDDASTREVPRSGDQNTILVKHDVNLGLAQSLIHGYRKALETTAEIIIRTDPDGEYPISAVPKALDILSDKQNAGAFVEYRRSLKTNGLADASFHGIMGYVEGNMLLGFPMNQHSPGLQIYQRETVEKMLPILEEYVRTSKIRWGLDLVSIRLASEFGNVVPITLESHDWKERRPLKKILSQFTTATKIIITDKTVGFNKK